MTRKKQDLRRITINLPEVTQERLFKQAKDEGKTVTNLIEAALETKLVVDVLAGDTGHVIGITATGEQKTIITDPIRFARYMGATAINPQP